MRLHKQQIKLQCNNNKKVNRIHIKNIFTNLQYVSII